MSLSMRRSRLLLCLASVTAVTVSGAGGAAAQEPREPSFLDVPDRPLDARPTPSAESAAGLAELEGELTRFGDRLRAYRRDVDALAERRARAERRSVLGRRASLLRAERRLEAAARREALARLEAFVRAHPRAPRHTPDALLRLAELYTERAFDALDTGRTDRLELSPAIAATERVVLEFPRYERRDRAAYLLGWALAESGREHEAADVYRALVCANVHGYPPRPSSDGGDAPLAQPSLHHPALERDAERRRTPTLQAYVGCAPALASELEVEVWLRLGEIHFDVADLDAAIGAYRHVVAAPADRLYAFGLYKLAWSHYRAGHYAEAIERFAQLIDHSDEVERATGRAGSELRGEALQYIALTLAWDDWDEDGQPDHAAGGAHPLERLEDPSLWPHDRPWAREVYRRVGDVLFEQAHPDEAIFAWRLRLAGFQACDDADVHLSIVRAHRQRGDEDAALEALEALATRAPEGCHADRARLEQLGRRALETVAHIHHERAQRARHRSDADARRHYDRAVEVYRRYVAAYPNHPSRYAIRYDLADALYWSGRWAEAAEVYAAVRDSRVDDRLFARAARRVVESFARVAEAARTALPEEPASAPREVPLALQRIARAREIYVRWVTPAEDEERVRDAFAFNNAVLLERFGYAEAAARRFHALFTAHCAGPAASEVGRDAWWAMHAIATAREDLDALERLTSEVRARRCSFAPDAEPVLAEGCEGELCEHVPRLEVAVRFRRLLDEARAMEGIPDGADRRARAEHVAARLVSSADRAPAHPQTPAALHLAAQLLADEAGRPAAAATIYQRIVDELGPRRGADEAARRELDAIVADAHFQLARSAQRAFDYERALAGYETLLTTPRFAGGDEEMSERRRDAAVNAAILTARLGRHADAARAWTRAAERLDGDLARAARLAAAEEMLTAGDARAAARALDGWLSEEARADAPTVRAWWTRAEAAAALGDAPTRERALHETRSAFSAASIAPSAEEAELAARAALALADLRAAETTHPAIDPGRRPSMRRYVDALRARVREESARAAPVIDAYAAVHAMGRAREGISALRRQGERYEALVRVVLASRFTLPDDVRRQIRGASPAARDEVRARLEDALRATLDELVRPVECLAVERYALAARLSARASLPTLESDRARQRLAAYGEERVAVCLARAHERDPSFEGLRPGELSRSRPGRHAGRVLGPPALEDRGTSTAPSPPGGRGRDRAPRPGR